jgi:FkbM family methyltransferase
MPTQLSAIIPCKNERDNIRACIVSARQVADEVLVADSGSTDGTLEIARELGCRIIEREYGTSGDFKNWAIPQAKHEWVFILDADERITAELSQEIRDAICEPKNDGYWVYRLNHFMGHPICHGPWRNDRCLRLFRRDIGRYVGPTDHAEVKLSSGTVGRLNERLVHYTCTSYTQYLPKISRYADVQAQLWKEEGRQPKLLQLLFRFPTRFIQGYVLRFGFLDGLAGLQVCALVAYLSWLKQACLWQLQSGRDTRELDSRTMAVLAAPPGKAEGYQAEGAGSGFTSTEESTGEANGTQEEVQAEATRKSFRAWRHRVTPRWLRTDSRRRRRNIILRRIGYQRCFTPPIIIRDPSLIVRSSLRYVVANELITNPRMTFLQIGAFDGVGEDDLRELVKTHNLRGVMVEPQPSAFARLQQTYRNQRQVTLLQAAIAESEGTRDLYCHRNHASMAASFDRQHLRKHGISDRDIVAQPVPCHTIESALRVGGLTNVDLLQIDAEGYDWPIIRSIDLSRIQPRMIRFEYRHMSDADADACVTHLAAHGYRFLLESNDIIAIQIEATGATTTTVRRSA